MNNVKRLVFATNNAHKLEEARRIIGQSFEIVSLAEIGCHDEIPETADTLEGNALIKARWVKEGYGYDCFSDDTGLMVDALNGAPGVYSARYAGENCTPADNVAKLLTVMEGETNRSAHFATVVALVWDGEEHCFEGRVNGSIARQPHGDGGFGYDPVFVAEESGKCFAEMAPEDKNEISHRGRAMRKLRDFLATLASLLILLTCSLSASAQQWRIHSVYDGQMDRIVDTPEYTYFLGVSQKYDPYYKYTSNFYGLLMRYDKQGDELQTLNSGNLLSGNIVRAIEYNPEKKYLAVAYDDGNIDLLYDNGECVNIPGLKMADASVPKNINGLHIAPQEGLIYVATDFGFITIDDKRNEIGTSRVLNVPVKAISKYDGELWLAINDKIYAGDPKSLNLDSFREIADIEMPVRMYPLGKKGMVILHGRINNMQCSRIEPDSEEYKAVAIQKGSCRGLEPMKQGLLLTAGNAVQTLMPEGKDGWYRLPESTQRRVAASYNGTDFWISEQRHGISQKRLSPEDGSWTVLKDNFFPNVSSAFMCSAMAFSPEYGTLIRNHSMDQNFNSDAHNYFETEDLISAYKDMEWARVSTTYRNESQGLKVIDPNGIAIDPNNPDHVYGGSLYSGLLRIDLKDASKSLRFSRPSDKSAGAGEPGFVNAVPEPEEGAFWADRCLFAAPGFDSYGNLWSLYVNPVPDAGGSSYNELWYWTPQDRASTTSAANARPFKKIRINNMASSNNPKILPLKSEANKNFIVFDGNALGEPLVIYDHNGTPDNKSDDRMAKMTSFHDQDGSNVAFNYAYSFYEDPATGIVWVGHNHGLFLIEPKETFSNPSQVRRIKVARNDGTNLADYLLNEVPVNQIISDKSGNKWFATTGAGLMCTSSDGREILYNYTSENSPLPGNTVYSLCLNPDTNSIMISTDKGLCELFLSGTIADTGSDVRVFPNPARPDFHGYVTIDGLEPDAMVKIVDTTGSLVKELGQSSLGSIEWDLTNHSHRKVPGGVYFVLATQGPDSNTYSRMARILVIE